jgi:hypothetical protein
MDRNGWTDRQVAAGGSRLSQRYSIGDNAIHSSTERVKIGSDEHHVTGANVAMMTTA